MAIQDGFTAREFYHAWALVTDGIEFTETEASRLDPQRQRLAKLVNTLCIWRAEQEHRVSDEAQASYEELKARIRQRRRRFRELDWMVRACMLHSERVPEEIREVVLLKPRGWQAIIAESKRQRRNAHPGKRRTDALQQLIEGIISKNPKLPWKQVLQKLERDHKGKGVLKDIKGDLIECVNTRGVSEYSQVSGLPDRVSRSRKKLKFALTG